MLRSLSLQFIVILTLIYVKLREIDLFRLYIQI